MRKPASWRKCRACDGGGDKLGPPQGIAGYRPPVIPYVPCDVCGGEGVVPAPAVVKPPPPPQGMLIEGRPVAEAGPESLFYGEAVPGVQYVSRDTTPFALISVQVAEERGFGSFGNVIEVKIAHREGWTNIDLARQIAGTYADAHKLTWEAHYPSRGTASRKRKFTDQNPTSATYGKDKMLVESTWSFKIPRDSLLAAHPELGIGMPDTVRRMFPVWNSMKIREELGLMTTQLRRPNRGLRGTPQLDTWGKYLPGTEPREVASPDLQAWVDEHPEYADDVIYGEDGYHQFQSFPVQEMVDIDLDMPEVLSLMGDGVCAYYTSDKDDPHTRRPEIRKNDPQGVRGVVKQFIHEHDGARPPQVWAAGTLVPRGSQATLDVEWPRVLVWLGHFDGFKYRDLVGREQEQSRLRGWDLYMFPNRKILVAMPAKEIAAGKVRNVIMWTGDDQEVTYYGWGG